jgi:hypothetical protein
VGQQPSSEEVPSGPAGRRPGSPRRAPSSSRSASTIRSPRRGACPNPPPRVPRLIATATGLTKSNLPAEGVADSYSIRCVSMGGSGAPPATKVTLATKRNESQKPGVPPPGLDQEIGGKGVESGADSLVSDRDDGWRGRNRPGRLRPARRLTPPTRAPTAHAARPASRLRGSVPAPGATAPARGGGPTLLAPVPRSDRRARTIADRR